MTSVAPPPPPPPPPPPATTTLAPQLTITFSSAPLALSQMALDSLISGLIKPASVQGETVLQTNLGTFQFKSPFMLPQGAQASFKLVQIEPTVQIQLTHINGKPIPTNTPASRVATLANQFMQQGSVQSGTLTQTAQAGIGNASGPATLINLNTATGLRAFVLSNNPGQATAPGQGLNTAFTTPTSPASTAQASTTTGATAQTATIASNITGQSGSAQVLSQNTSGPFQTGNQLSVRLLSVQQPGQDQINTTSSGTTTPKSVTVQGTVQGTTGAGQPIIRTPQGLIALDTTTRIPDGALIRLEVLSSSKPASAASIAQATTSPSQALGKKWPALEEALLTMRDSNPAVSDHLSNALIPRPDQRMAANIIFFLKALGRGNLKNWADDQTLRAISKFKPGLLKKLENDFAALSTKSKQPTSTDWKIAYVPMQGDGNLQQIRIAQRDHQEEEEEGDKDEGGLRFVIDIDLSQMGPMQFDGLAKEKTKKFDLIIRTNSTLAGHVRKDIHDIFENSMDAVGFDGNIVFQVTSQFVNVEGLEVQAGTLNLGMLV